jgi:FMN phosphatase YigB (HAD superfamily)
VSNGASSQQHAKIDALGFRALVDVVVVSDDLGIAKPDPEIFHYAARQAGSTLSDAWMIGDSPVHDIVGAHGVGANTAWIHRGRTWTYESVLPTVTLASVAEFPAEIARYMSS